MRTQWLDNIQRRWLKLRPGFPAAGLNNLSTEHLTPFSRLLVIDSLGPHSYLASEHRSSLSVEGTKHSKAKEILSAAQQPRQVHRSTCLLVTALC